MQHLASFQAITSSHPIVFKHSIAATALFFVSPYRSLFRCGECGCVITTETQKGHHYLRCTKRVTACSQKYVREEVVSDQVDRAISKAALEDAIADAMLAELKRERDESAQAETVAVEATKAALAACERQIDLLLDLRLSEQIGEAE